MDQGHFSLHPSRAGIVRFTSSQSGYLKLSFEHWLPNSAINDNASLGRATADERTPTRSIRSEAFNLSMPSIAYRPRCHCLGLSSGHSSPHLAERAKWARWVRGLGPWPSRNQHTLAGACPGSPRSLRIDCLPEASLALPIASRGPNNSLRPLQYQLAREIVGLQRP